LRLMREPKPTPRPRDRKARRKLSPGQVAFLQRKAEREKAKGERKAKQRLDAWYLLRTRPEIAKARREKGVENNAKAWAWRRQSFIDSFTDWPSVLTAEEMRYRIRVHWLPSQRKMKWRGCEKHYPDKEASVRKKLTELGVFRYNSTLRTWFRCGSVEEAEATQRLADEAEAKRRLQPAEEGWFDNLIPVHPRDRAECEQTILRWCKVASLADVSVESVEYFQLVMRSGDYSWRVENLLIRLARDCLAEAVLVAD
jgi:hypothetical protein